MDWDGLASTTRAAEDRTKVERDSCKVICGAQKTLQSLWDRLDSGKELLCLQMDGGCL